MTITVLYSCAGCGLTKVKADVPVRESDEDLMTWMERLQRLLSIDHRRRSPNCEAESMQEVAIPLQGRGGRVGGPVQH